MVINGTVLLEAAPIKDMVAGKIVGPGGTSFGLGEAGYDIRIKQTVEFHKGSYVRMICEDSNPDDGYSHGRFTLASAIEEFDMPDNLMGIVHDKSTWARRGLQVFNTVIEPGWKGFLTLELAYWGQGELIIPAGSGIAQVVFHGISCPAAYSGKYQDQDDYPVPARNS